MSARAPDTRYATRTIPRPRRLAVTGDSWTMWGYGAVAVLVLLWNVAVAGAVATARRQSRLFLALTSLCGLFIVPGALIAVASGMVLTARVLHFVAWAWPVILLCFVLQSAYALARGLVGAWFALPVVCFNVLVLAAATARLATAWFTDLPPPLMAAALSQLQALSLLFGRDALANPWLLVLPVLAPAFPARRVLAGTTRVALAMGACIGAAATVAAYPRAVHAASSFAPLGATRLQERPRGDFMVGVRLLPTIHGPPAPLPIARDLALADTLGARVVSLLIAPDGARPLALDSLANTLADLRRDSVLLAVTLAYDASDAATVRRDPASYRDRRLAMVDQVVRRLRPDVLVPAQAPMEAGRRALGALPVAWWIDYHERAASLAHRLRPRTRVALVASAFSPADSALYAWGAGARAIDLLAFALAPSFGGGASVDARLRLAARWMRASRKDHWILSARAFPRAFGETNQARALWGMLAWASSQPRVRAFVVEGAGDYDALDGLRDPGGRLRPAVASVARARQALAESSEGRE